MSQSVLRIIIGLAPEPAVQLEAVIQLPAQLDREALLASLLQFVDARVHGGPALIQAAGNGDVLLVNMLLGAGADPHYRDDEAISILAFCHTEFLWESRHAQASACMRSLLRSGANPHVLEFEKWRLDDVLLMGGVETAVLMLRGGLDRTFIPRDLLAQVKILAQTDPTVTSLIL